MVSFLPLNSFIIINTNNSGVLKSLPYKVIFTYWAVDRRFIEEPEHHCSFGFCCVFLPILGLEL
jgi:hypothetical protein